MKNKFPLTSEQLELLLAFEKSKGLSDLAQSMGRDSSVISRQLQKLAEDYPVLVKDKGKWIISPLGFKVNEVTTKSIHDFELILKIQDKKFLPKSHTALLVINAQDGILKIKTDRSNPAAEKNIKKLLTHWRHLNSHVFHIKHISENPESLFYKNAATAEFGSELAPVNNEPVFEKLKASAFSNPGFVKTLEKENITNLILTGFTANECVEATAREAHEKGFNTLVIGDATAMFDLMGHDKKLYKAEKIHELVLANINALYAQIETTQNILSYEIK